MKKNILIIIFAMFLMASGMPDLSFVRGSLIEMHVSVSGSDREGLDVGGPRDLVEIPTVSIENGILYFYDVFSTTVPVFVVDASDNVVFSATLYPGEDKKVLPTSLSGTYTLYMRVGTIMYSAVITI